MIHVHPHFFLKNLSAFTLKIIISIAVLSVPTVKLKAQSFGVSTASMKPYVPSEWPEGNTGKGAHSAFQHNHLFVVEANIWRKFISEPRDAPDVNLSFTYKLQHVNTGEYLPQSTTHSYLSIHDTWIHGPRIFYGFKKMKFDYFKDFQYLTFYKSVDRYFDKDRIGYVAQPVFIFFYQKYYDDKISDNYRLIITTEVELGNKVTANFTFEPLKAGITALDDPACTGLVDQLKINLNTPGQSNKKVQSIAYRGDGESFLRDKPSDLQMRPGQQEGNLFLNVNPVYAQTPKKLELEAYLPGHLPSRAKIELQPASGLSLSAQYQVSNKSISLTVSIPECHRDNTSSTAISITCDEQIVTNLVNLPVSVIIPAGTTSATVAIPLSNTDRCSQTLTISANSLRFSNTSSVTVALPINRKIHLSATYYPASNYRKERITAELKMPALNCNETEYTRTFNLTYSSASLVHLINPPSSLTVSVGEGSKKFDIYLRGERCLNSSSKFKLSATTSFEKIDSNEFDLPSAGQGIIDFKYNATTN